MITARFITILPLLTLVACAHHPVKAADPIEEYKKRFMAQNHFVSDAVFEQIYNLAVKYNGHDEKERENSEELRNVYCNGTTPRFVVKKTVNFQAKAESGLALDAASHNMLMEQEMAKFYYKQDFLYISGWGKDVSQHLLHRTYYPHDSVDGTIYVSGTEYRMFSSHNKQLAVDMGILLKQFTFKIPKNLISTMYRAPSDMLNVDRFGYSEGEFHASEAIEFKDYIWRYVLIHDTQVKEAANENGTTTFEVTWTPNLFCKYGVSIESLKSR